MDQNREFSLLKSLKSSILLQMNSELMRLFSLMNGGGNPADLLPHLGQMASVTG
jgi:hypothetical protein